MPQKIKQNKRDKVRLNLMVIGESGLGKTTFLECLLRKYDPNTDSELQTSIADKTNNIEKVGNFELVSENGDALEIFAYDSPGYGDFINNQECIDKIKAYILKCHKQWKELDPQSMTEAEFFKADNRIHCIFYFIGPHRMKRLDREFISQIAQIVPIIPIVAKADSMTIPERIEYLNIINTTLAEITNKIHEPCIYDFKGDDVSAVNNNAANTAVSTERIPNIFAVVCDKSSERVYPWGTLKIDDEKHNDLRRLQICLFENGKFI